MKARGAAFVAAARSLALSTSSHPLPLTPHESQLIETFLAVITALFVLIPMCYLVGSYALFPVKERSAGAKHLMAMAGCGPLPYWLGTYLYDLTAHKARAASPRGPPPAAQIGCRASRAHLLDPPHSFGVVVLLRSFSPKVVVLTVMGAFWLFSDVAFVGTRSAAVVRGRAYGRYHLGAHLCVLAFFFGIAAPAALCAAALPCALPAARLSPDRLSLPPTASLPAAAGHQSTLVISCCTGPPPFPSPTSWLGPLTSLPRPRRVSCPRAPTPFPFFLISFFRADGRLRLRRPLPASTRLLPLHHLNQVAIAGLSFASGFVCVVASFVMDSIDDYTSNMNWRVGRPPLESSGLPVPLLLPLPSGASPIHLALTCAPVRRRSLSFRLSSCQVSALHLQLLPRFLPWGCPHQASAPFSDRWSERARRAPSREHHPISSLTLTLSCSLTAL